MNHELELWPHGCMGVALGKQHTCVTLEHGLRAPLCSESLVHSLGEVAGGQRVAECGREEEQDGDTGREEAALTLEAPQSSPRRSSVFSRLDFRNKPDSDFSQVNHHKSLGSKGCSC